MLIKNVIIVIFILLSSVSELPKNSEEGFIMNHFNDFSLIVAETETERIKVFEDIKNNPEAIVEKIKQEQGSNILNENDLGTSPDQNKYENIFHKQREKKLKSRKKKRQIKRRKAKDLFEAYNQAKAKAQSEDLRFSPYNKVVYNPGALLSKNYWMYKLFPNKINRIAQNSKNPELYLEKYRKSYQTIKKATKEEVEAAEKRLQQKELRKKLEIRDLIYDIKFGFHSDITKIKPETLRNTDELIFYPLEFREYFKFSWSNVINYGPTIKEVENVLIIIAFIRFCVYAIRYNIKTAFIICSIGLISSFVYILILVDFISIPFTNLYLCPSFFRFLFEESLYKEGMDESAFLAGFLVDEEPRFSLKSLIKDYLYKIKWWWVDEIVDYRLRPTDNWLSRFIVDSPIPSYIEKVIEYIQKVMIPFCSRVLEGYKSNLKGLLVYFIVLRAGKKIVPYHIQWNVMFYCLYMNFGSYMWDWHRNAQELLQLTLIPQMRYREIYFMNLLESTILGIFFYLLMLAMLHAVFSQYFYIPLWVPNMESHIGLRPKNDIYSGGYTSWQDEIKFWEPSAADLKLWFGFLGKGPKDKKKKRKKRRKNKK